MSVKSQIERITQNIANAYAVLKALGCDMPEEQNSDNLSSTAGTSKVVKYIAQTLTDAQKSQARTNIGAASQAEVSQLSEQIADKQPKGNYALKNEIPSVPVKSVNGKTGAVVLSANDVGATTQAYVNQQLEGVVQQVISALGTPVFGRVLEDKTIILSGTLVSGSYNVKYEMEDGSMVDVGRLLNASDETIIPVWNKGYKLDSSTGVASVDSANTYAYSDGIPFIDGTELRISCSDRFNFHCHWYYYDASGKFVGKTDWMTSNQSAHEAMPETVIPQITGATNVKLRCNVVNAGEWTDLDRLTVIRRYV